MISFTSDQRYIVTGASSGIGESVALLLNELGAAVIGIGRSRERLDGMKAKAKYPENVFLEQKDLTEDIEGLPAYVKALKDKYGKFQGMALCAGIGRTAPLNAFDLSEARKIFDIDYFAPLMMTKGFADRRVNTGRGAAIVAISSIAGISCEKGLVTYGGAKAALSASLKAASREVGTQGIRINCISPSFINTPMTQSTPNEELLEKASKEYLFGFGTVSDAANMIIFLLSDKSKWITGQNYILDCGTY
ncbi:MAG: SDR family oxidoreductase [Alphaproteobacteria bacterium]|nr:SDR family oxidoreductase [Alphaproteobacteria bacterium]